MAIIYIIVKRKVHSRTGHECPEEEEKYNLRSRWEWVLSATPPSHYAQERERVPIMK